MKFRQFGQDPMEINLTPLIDVVFLLLIFFMVSTSFQSESEIEINLPSASRERADLKFETVEIFVDKQNRFFIDRNAVEPPTTRRLRDMLEALMQDEEMSLVVNADAEATHQSVVKIMDAARQLGLKKVVFSTQMALEGEEI